VCAFYVYSYAEGLKDRVKVLTRVSDCSYQRSTLSVQLYMT